MKSITIIKTIQPHLEEAGLAVFYKESEDKSRLDQLIIPLAKEDGTALNIEINTIADPHNIYPTTHFLQCFITLPFQITAEYEERFKALIPQVNLELPIGSFNFHEAGVIFYKYTIIVDNEDPKHGVAELLNAIDISNHLFQSYEAAFLELLKV